MKKIVYMVCLFASCTLFSGDFQIKNDIMSDPYQNGLQPGVDVSMWDQSDLEDKKYWLDAMNKLSGKIAMLYRDGASDTSHKDYQKLTQTIEEYNLIVDQHAWLNQYKKCNYCLGVMPVKTIKERNRTTDMCAQCIMRRQDKLIKKENQALLVDLVEQVRNASHNKKVHFFGTPEITYVPSHKMHYGQTNGFHVSNSPSTGTPRNAEANYHKHRRAYEFYEEKNKERERKTFGDRRMTLDAKQIAHLKSINNDQ